MFTTILCPALISTKSSLSPPRFRVNKGPIPIVVGLCRQVGQHHGVNTGARRHLPDVVRAQMSRGHLLFNTDLLVGGHYLPLTGLDQQSHTLFDRICFGHEEISASRKFSKGIVGAGVTCEHDHAVRCIEAIGIRFVLARGWALMESKMGVFDGCHLHVGVLKNHSSADIMAEEQLIYRYCAASVGDPDLSTNGEILHRSLD